MIVLGLIGRPDSPWCHDATAALLIDGVVVGALEQERISHRRYAPGEGPEDAVRILLAEHGLKPSDVDSIGYAWADASAGRDRRVDTDLAGGVLATDRLTATILPTMAGELGNAEILFFDHHLCHAAQTYWFNPQSTADILVADGTGGAGSTSLIRATDGRFELLDRYDFVWSLGVFYEAAAAYAGLGWDAAGKLMGLSSYGQPSGRRFLGFDEAAGQFRLDASLRAPAGGLTADNLAHDWLATFEQSAFPYTAGAVNTFDYASFAADVQATLEDVGQALVRRLRRRSGAPALLVAGGVALNAHLNRLLARFSGYDVVASSAAPHDGGAAIGAGLLAASLAGEPVRRPDPADPPAIFLGPAVSTHQIEAALAGCGGDVRALETEVLRAEVAASLHRGEIVALVDGPIELGPRALGARSLLASPRSRRITDRLNAVKGRAPWRPAALSMTGDAFDQLSVEPAVPGLTEYMLCVHQVDPRGWPAAIAGVHVDGTTRAQFVPDDSSFGGLLGAVRAESGLAAVINTSFNVRGQPMVLTPRDAVDVFAQSPDIDVLAMPPYLVRRA